MFRVTHLSVGKRVGTPLIVSQQLHVATQITFGGQGVACDAACRCNTVT